MQGWTYFIQAKEGGLIKIGYTSKHPEIRLRDLQIGSPQELTILATIPGNVETSLHRLFANWRQHGEWFQACPELVSYIRNNSSQLHEAPKHMPLSDRYIQPPNTPAWGRFYDAMDHEER
jgi:hypothetical protein